MKWKVTTIVEYRDGRIERSIDTCEAEEFEMSLNASLVCQTTAIQVPQIKKLTIIHEEINKQQPA